MTSCLTFLIAAVVFLCAHQAAHAQSDPAAAALHVFQQKCAACHGPELARPKGKFGHVTDLARLAADVAHIVPGEPEKSELFLLVDRGEMPPPRSKYAPMSAAEKDAIRQWIAGGALPIAASTPDQPPSQPPAAQQAGATSGRTSLNDQPLSVGRLVGRMHPAVIHFPVAMLMVAILAEVLLIITGRASFRTVVLFCIIVGTLGSLAAVATGWMLAEHAGYASSTNEYFICHQRLGFVTTGLAIVTLGLYARSIRANQSNVWRWLARAALLAVAVISSLTGHFGGVLVYGPVF